MRKTAVSAVILMILLIGAAEVYAAAFGVESEINYMQWKEYLISEKPFVEEGGFLHSLVGNVLCKPTKNSSLKSNLKFFSGDDISYKGSFVEDHAPHNTNGTWWGIRLEELADYKLKISENFRLNPFISVELAIWQRLVSAETWYSVIGKMGLKLENQRWFIRAWLSRPIYTENEGSWENVSWVNGGRKTYLKTNPRGEFSPNAEIGVKFQRMTISFSYEQLKWERSESMHFNGGVNIFQPETVLDIFSFRIGIHF